MRTAFEPTADVFGAPGLVSTITVLTGRTKEERTNTDDPRWMTSIVDRYGDNAPAIPVVVAEILRGIVRILVNPLGQAAQLTLLRTTRKRHYVAHGSRDGLIIIDDRAGNQGRTRVLDISTFGRAVRVGEVHNCLLAIACADVAVTAVTRVRVRRPTERVQLPRNESEVWRRRVMRKW